MKLKRSIKAVTAERLEGHEIGQHVASFAGGLIDVGSLNTCLQRLLLLQLPLTFQFLHLRLCHTTVCAFLPLFRHICPFNLKCLMQN